MAGHHNGKRFGETEASVPHRCVLLVFAALAVCAVAVPTGAFASAPGPGTLAGVEAGADLDVRAGDGAATDELAASAEAGAAAGAGSGASAAADEAVAQDPVAGELAADEAVAQDPVAQDSAMGEPVAGGSVADESAADGSVADDAWCAQLGAWHARHDREAVDAAKQTSRERPAADEGSNAASRESAPDASAPGAAVLAAASLGAGSACLVMGWRRRKRPATAVRMPAPTLRRPI